MATVILAKKYKEPLDEVVYCEVMFDEETSGEVPEHRDFVYRIAIPRLKRAGIPVHIVRGEKTFVGQFQHRISGEGRSAGKMWSWPLCGKCYVQRDLKVRPMDAWKRKHWQGDEIIQCRDSRRRDGSACQDGQLPISNRVPFGKVWCDRRHGNGFVPQTRAAVSNL